MTVQYELCWSVQELIAGVDEAGRGPLAGPVVAAAVILDSRRPISGLADSKALSPVRREMLAGEIRDKALAWALGQAGEGEIDEMNILQASLLAMRRAVAGLRPAPQHVVVDGLHCPRLECSVEAVVKADGTIPAVSAASILAKVARDLHMIELEERYPGYGFKVHKGYPTKAHCEALVRLGPCPAHRRSFAPVRRCLKTR